LLGRAVKKRCKINLVVWKSSFIFALALKAERQIFGKRVFRTGCTRHKIEIKNLRKFAGNKKRRIFAVLLRKQGRRRARALVLRQDFRVAEELLKDTLPRGQKVH
jgi:predicted Fe-S protein YdhL (DUF1289 family)